MVFCRDNREIGKLFEARGIPATNHALCQLHISGIHDPLVQKSGAARARGPQSYELLSLVLKKTQWAQVQGLDRQHRPLEIIYVTRALLHHQRYKYKLQENREIYSPPCAPPSTFANGESLHMGVQLSSQRFRSEQWRRRCKAISHSTYHTLL